MNEKPSSPKHKTPASPKGKCFVVYPATDKGAEDAIDYVKSNHSFLFFGKHFFAADKDEAEERLAKKGGMRNPIFVGLDIPKDQAEKLFDTVGHAKPADINQQIEEKIVAHVQTVDFMRCKI